jgi:hypothetical protein
MAEPPLRQGTIARARIRPERGQTKSRYGVIYTPDSVIALSANVDLVAISTSCYPDDPNSIVLPWSPDGRVMTRLTVPCSIVLTMTDTLPISEVTATWGHVPKSVLAEMLDGLKKHGKIT